MEDQIFFKVFSIIVDIQYYFVLTAGGGEVVS